MSENNLYKTLGNDESGAFCRFGEPRLHVGDGRFSLKSRYCHSSGRRVILLEVQCSAILALLLGNKVSLAAVISVIHRTSSTCISQRIRSPSQLKILAQDTTVELYLYSPSGPSWPVLGRTLLYMLCNSENKVMICVYINERCR